MDFENELVAGGNGVKCGSDGRQPLASPRSPDRSRVVPGAPSLRSDIPAVPSESPADVADECRTMFVVPSRTTHGLDVVTRSVRISR